MKKLFTLVLSVLIFSFLFTGCDKIPEPAIKQGSFNFSVTYEVDGQQETVSGVFVCEFVKAVSAIGGEYREWNSYIDDEALEQRLAQTRGYLLLKNVEDGQIFLDLNLSAKYFMADPHYVVNGDFVDATNWEISPRLFIEYSDSKYAEIGLSYSEDVAVLESYGVKVVRFEYDSPVENVYE